MTNIQQHTINGVTFQFSNNGDITFMSQGTLLVQYHVDTLQQIVNYVKEYQFNEGVSDFIKLDGNT